MKRRVRKEAPGLTLEQALPALRRGRMIRRRSWVAGVKLISANGHVYLHIERQRTLQETPLPWIPYSECVLARDWEVVKVKRERA